MSFLDADSQELKNVLKEKLSSNGTLESLEGTLRAKLFACICPEPLKSLPAPARETLLINELIREYLKWNGYVGTLSVLNAESNAPKSQMDKSMLIDELGLTVDSYPTSIPLLYGLCAKSIRQDRQDTNIAPFENSQNYDDVIEFNSQ